MKQAYFKLLFNQNGEVVGAELTPEGEERGCVLWQGDEVTPEFLAKKFAEHRKQEAIGSSIIKLSGSPDCIIYIGGFPICICC